MRTNFIFYLIFLGGLCLGKEALAQQNPRPSKSMSLTQDTLDSQGTEAVYFGNPQRRVDNFDFFSKVDNRAKAYEQKENPFIEDAQKKVDTYFSEGTSTEETPDNTIKVDPSEMKMYGRFKDFHP